MRRLQIVLTLVLGVYLYASTANRSCSNPGDPCVKCACRAVAAALDAVSKPNFYQWRYKADSGSYTEYSQAYDGMHTHDKTLCEKGAATTEDAEKWLPIWTGYPCGYVCAQGGQVLLPIECATGSIVDANKKDYLYLCVE